VLIYDNFSKLIQIKIGKKGDLQDASAKESREIRKNKENLGGNFIL
jgi:hypothetical protein